MNLKNLTVMGTILNDALRAAPIAHNDTDAILIEIINGIVQLSSSHPDKPFQVQQDLPKLYKCIAKVFPEQFSIEKLKAILKGKNNF